MINSTVILLEPDRILSRQYEDFMSDKGVNIETCSDAQSAIMLADKNKPALVVLELLLREHSGIEFLHEFRSYSDWSQVPVIVHSSVPQYSFGVNDQTWRDMGVVEYFYKPTTKLIKLHRAIREYIE